MADLRVEPGITDVLVARRAPPAPSTFDELKAYVGFTPDDADALRAFWPLIEPRAGEIVDRFYARVLAAPDSRAVLQDHSRIERLKHTFGGWLRDLFLGPHDDAYFERHQRIGRVHVQVGLPAPFMLTFMSAVRDDILEIARQTPLGDDPARLLEVMSSVQRVTSLDLATMTSTYIQTREERQLATLQELIVSHLPVTVLLLDATGRISATTASAARLLGGTELTGRHFLEALPRPLIEAAQLEAQLERALDTGREINVLRVDVDLGGRRRSFRMIIVPLEHPQARALLYLEEMTEAIETEARLRQAETLAQLGAFSAAVAHELRNPLAGISGAVQVIARSFDAKDSRRGVLEKVEQQIQRLNIMISEMLSFARPPEPRMTEVDLAGAARSAIELVERQHPGVRVELRGAGDALADPHFVQQIALNLLLNAVQAAGEGGRFTVVVEPRRLTVSDSGPGVPPELRERIFLPFFTTRTRGTGLGLAISRQMAQAMGAALTLGSGNGATFVLAFG